MSILLDLSYWGVFAEPVPRGRLANAGRSVPVSKMDLSALTKASLTATPSGERVLIAVDDPEHVQETGLLYQQPLAGPVRVFAYAVNATVKAGKAQDMTLGVAVQAPSGSTASVTVQRSGSANGVSSGPYAVSMLAAERWMATLYSILPGSTVILNPGQTQEFASARMPAIANPQQTGYPGYVANIILDIDIQPAGSEPATVLVYARQPAAAGTPTIPSNQLGSTHTPPTRGLFPIADVAVSATAGMDSWVPLPAGLMPQQGVSFVDGAAAATNAGFGVFWTASLAVSASATAIPAPRYAAVGMGPASPYGIQTGAFWTQGNNQTILSVVAPPGSGLLLPGQAMQLGTVPVGQSASVRWMGTGGIGYPVGIYVLTPQTRTGQILSVAGVGAVAGLAGLVGYAAGAGARAGG